MEVHAHTHTARKKWTHYFWEFLMLFLAVFCGFMAENIREHKVEDQRAKGLAKNLYKEIYEDSIAVQQKMALRTIKENACTYFINYIKDSNLTTLPPEFYPEFTRSFLHTALMYFEPNDGILNQLRNSGELRYFKNRELQAIIGKLSVMIANVRTRNDKEYGFLELNIRRFTLQHYDFNWYEAFTQHGKISLSEAFNKPLQVQVVGKIVNLDKFNRLEAENIASYYLLMLRGTRQSQYTPYATINHQLLEALRKEYRLK